MEAIRVLVVDDHPIYRKGIIEILKDLEGFLVCGEAEDGQEAIERVRTSRPNIVLMDITMKRTDGIAATAIITSENPNIKVIILTISENDEKLFDALRAGAHGYLIKTVSPGELIDSIRDVNDGGSVISPHLAVRLLNEFKEPEQLKQTTGKPDLTTNLTRRELEVLRLMATGQRNREIAEHLYISEGAVKFHVSNILAKLHLRNRAEAVRYAHEEGLLD